MSMSSMNVPDSAVSSRLFTRDGRKQIKDQFNRACEEGLLEVVKLFLEQCEKAGLQLVDEEALRLADEKGHQEVCDFLKSRMDVTK